MTAQGNITITGTANGVTGKFNSSDQSGGGGAYTPIFQDDFESGANGDLLTARGFSRTNATVSTDRAYNGTKSAKHIQVLGSDMDQLYGAAKVLPVNLIQGDEFWIRDYFYFPAGWDFGNSGNAGLGGSSLRSKFFRLHTKTTGGTNKGYNDLYLWKDGATNTRFNWIKEQIDAWAFTFIDDFNGSRPQAPPLTGIVRGTWVPIEYYVKLHSTPASARVRVWVNNILNFELTDLATLSLSTDVADEWQWCTYYNGGAPANQTCYTDKWVVATSAAPPTNTDANGNKFIGGT